MRHEQIYQAIKEEHETYGYSISALCRLGNKSRAAYYKWLHRDSSLNELKTNVLHRQLKDTYRISDKGYRRIRDDLERYHDIKVNDKRVLRNLPKETLNPQ